MKYISGLFIFSLISLSVQLQAQSLQSKCGRLTGDALQLCIAQWQADQANALQRDQQLQDSIRQGQEDNRERLRRMQQENDLRLQNFRNGCGSPGKPACY